MKMAVRVRWSTVSLNTRPGLEETNEDEMRKNVCTSLEQVVLKP